MHTEEPNCAVKNAVNTNEVAAERYISYRNILDSISEKTY